MNHAWQLTNLELSKRLKELGVKQESLWWWYMLKTTYGEKPHLRLHKGSPKHEYYSAFTVAELGEMLPTHIKEHFLEITKRKNFSGVGSHWSIDYHNYLGCEANTEANARAKMKIYLLENKL